ncbi:MAG TPA: PSD1 and planctomycete cytochrome C domain-containing protein [Planctomycetaceae bacterium]|nr:PSD1 and planctomycete cytochrome C domain-containing protein [Planctomycetaceae bacterium]
MTTLVVPVDLPQLGSRVTALLQPDILPSTGSRHVIKFPEGPRSRSLMLRQRALGHAIWIRLIIAIAEVASLQRLAAAEDRVSKPAIAKVDFDREVQPVLAKRCFRCHGPDKAEAGLRLDLRDRAFAKLASGSHALLAGNITESELLKRVSSSEPSERMPPEGKPLTTAEIDLIRRWIGEGAAWEVHWAFRPPVARVPPAVRNASWARNPVDAFILNRLEQNGLAPAPPAEKIALLRRAYYDLIGLPPTPAEADAFVADSSPTAYETVVDRLLDSPRYGEHWARHWLDIVRFAETNSFERDSAKPHAWRYRDYVIRALNADKPYDRFIREQLAGDELPDATRESMIATGYYRLGPWDDEPADRLQAKYDALDDLVATTGQVFLGLTVNCARCHDHKIDPISQKDYYGLLAFFHNITPYQTTGPNIEVPLLDDDQEREQFRASTREFNEKRKKDQAEYSALNRELRARFPKKNGSQRELAEWIKQNGATILGEERFQRYRALQASLRRAKQQPIPAGYALCVTESGLNAPDTFVLKRGNPHVLGEKVEPSFPRILDPRPPRLAPPQPKTHSTGRRLTLANWIASADNPATARVMVNRIWQHHFGRGIVRSPNNFGYLGDRPTHPEVLDWLAAEFVKNGWHLKSLHRLILTSSAYRMSSQADPAALARDPANDLFWRFDMRRLSAEEIRDSIHALSGRLNSKMYGPSIFPDISTEVLAGQSVPGAGWGKSSPQEQSRRSIYIHVKRSLMTPILADFDVADNDSSCAVRFTTTQPTQALAMLNGAFVHSQSAALAERLRHEAGNDPTAQVRLALRLALVHSPDPASVDRGLKLLATLEHKNGLSAQAALDFYCLAVLNLNEFLYLD